MTIDVSSLLCYKLFFLVKTNENLIDKRMKKFDLSRTQWKALIRFNFLPMPCPQQQLLQSMEIDRAHLTRILDQLEKRKLIERKREIHDKRSFNIFLTARGKKILTEMELIMKNDSDLLLSQLDSKEKKLFDTFVSKITTDLINRLQMLPD